jgi:spermidine synthase
MRLAAACLVAAASGFVALSHEILWVRVYGYATEGKPEAFGYLLAAYLAGLAAGSFVAGRCCERVAPGQGRLLSLAGVSLVVANVAAFLAIPVAGQLVSAWAFHPDGMLGVFGAAAVLLGIGFPLLAHFAVPADRRAGARVSYVYVSNIIGSTLGSLLTGLWLLEVWTLRELTTVLSISGTAVGAGLMLIEAGRARVRWSLAAGWVLVSGAILGTAPMLYGGLYHKLLFKRQHPDGEAFLHVVEGRGGVVVLTESGVVYGGGTYDGQMNISPLPGLDDNRVLRAYLVPAFHASPREVLMVGLGAGSWLQVLANCPGVDRVTVVEINPGFVEIARWDERVASALASPKVEIIIDDGRRYLRRTDRRFDVIVQNTIAFWRAHASNLLSREYLELSRRRLQPGGALYFNTTMSAAAQKTGATVFPHAVRFQNMLIAGDAPIVIDRARFARLLDEWRIDGQPVLPRSRRAADLDLLREQDWRGGTTWEDRESILARTHASPVITDDNMASEWWAWETHP